VGAHSVFIGTHGRRGFRAWGTGSVAARTAQLSRRPVIVYKGKPDRWEAWAKGTAPLRLLVGVDFSPATERALEWVRSLSDAGPCEVKLAHILWPPNEHKRVAAAGGKSSGGGVDDELERRCRTDLEARLSGKLPVGSSIEIRPNWGRPADALAEWGE